MKKIIVTLRNGNIVTFSPSYGSRETRSFLVIDEVGGKLTYIPLADITQIVEEVIPY